MMKTQNVIFYVLLAIFFSSCDEIFKSYSDEDGLKAALVQGTNKAVSILSQEDGYFKDQAVKILLPEEAQSAIKVLNTLSHLGIPGVSELGDNITLSMNRAAEAAATKATPIFTSAITNMTFADATNILWGADTAATQYLRTNTSSELIAQFQPEIDPFLDMKLVGTESTNSLWEKFTNINNQAANLPVVGSSLKPLNPSLSEHVTTQAINGLFKKVANEEIAIRTDPLARTSEILRSVFGKLDKE